MVGRQLLLAWPGIALASVSRFWAPRPAQSRRRIVRKAIVVGRRARRSMASSIPDQAILDGDATQPDVERSLKARLAITAADGIDSSRLQPPAPPTSDYCSPANVALCAGDPTAPPEEAAAPVVVTLRDIASFRPAAPDNGMEPGGWAIEGLPANFVAGASVQVVSGTLLGQPADVRFTPVGYRWTHSDGAVVEGGGPGATWAALGQREFSRDGHEPRVRVRRGVHGRPVGRRARRVPVRRVAVAIDRRHAQPRGSAAARARRRVRHGAHAGRLPREPVRPRLLTRRPAARRDGRPDDRRGGHRAVARRAATGLEVSGFAVAAVIGDDRRVEEPPHARHPLALERRALALGARAVAQEPRRRLLHGIEVARLRQLAFEPSDEPVAARPPRAPVRPRSGRTPGPACRSAPSGAGRPRGARAERRPRRWRRHPSPWARRASASRAPATGPR